MADDSLIEDRHKVIKETGLEVFGRIPTDPLLGKLESNSGSILNISEESPALKAVQDLILWLNL